MADIKKELNDIKNAVYGREVRSSIHDGIKKINEEVENTTDRQDSVEAQFHSVLDEMTEKDVTSAPEILAARVGVDNTNYPNLKERLDTEHNQLSSQLAETRQRVSNNFVAIVQANNDISDLQKNKADISMLERLGNMTPKGAFLTLQDLENAYPNGTEGVYVIQADGHWYYWNGNEWAVGGLYQAQPWAEFMTEQNEEWVI